VRRSEGRTVGRRHNGNGDRHLSSQAWRVIPVRLNNLLPFSLESGCKMEEHSATVSGVRGFVESV
jgi:hypothetical protein